MGNGHVLQEGYLRSSHGRGVVSLQEHYVGLDLAEEPSEGLPDQPDELAGRHLSVRDLEAAIQGHAHFFRPGEVIAAMNPGAADRKFTARLGAQARHEGGELRGLGATGDEGQDLDDVFSVSAQERGITAAPVKGTP